MSFYESLLFFMLRFLPALVFSLASSIFLTLPFFQKSIGDSRVKELQAQINTEQQYIDANWRKGNYHDGSVNTDIKNTLDAKRRIITALTEEILKIREAPLESRELTFIQQMETAVEEAMKNPIDLYLHLFFWLFFFTVEMIPLMLFYLDRHVDSYSANTCEGERWRIMTAIEEISQRNRNEILAKKVETSDKVYQDYKKLKEHEVKIAKLDLEQRKELHQIGMELKRLDEAEKSSISEQINSDNSSLSDINSSAWSPTGSQSNEPALNPENPPPEPTVSTTGDKEMAQLEAPLVSNGKGSDSKDADFSKRLKRLTDDV